MKKQSPKRSIRALSWSSISLFEYDREAWYRKYILGEKTPDTAPLLFGKKIGGLLEKDPTFLPEVKRYKVMEKKLEGKMADIHLVGFLDTFNPETKAFREYKTSSNKTRWNQKKADEHGQLSFYFFLIWLNYGVAPESIECHLDYIPCRETNDFQVELTGEKHQSFKVKKTAVDILNFANYIRKTYDTMIEFVKERAGEN